MNETIIDFEEDFISNIHSGLKNIKFDDEVKIEDLRVFLPKSNFSCYENAVSFAIINSIIGKLNINNKNFTEIEDFEPESGCEMSSARIFMVKEEKTIYLSWSMKDVDFGAEENEDWCLMIREELENAYPEYEIKWCIFTFCVFSNEELTEEILQDFERASDKVYGVQEYIKFLGLDENVMTKDIYTGLFKDIVKLI